VTSAKVVDVSTLAAILFAEPEGIKAKMLIDEADLLAPTLLPYELASACFKKMRRHPQLAALLRSQFSLFSTLEIRLYPVDHDEILDLVGAHGLSVYDASYLWLALKRGYDLITLDQKLGTVWRSTSEKE
jgi:predicted nucleic acid-binding protein